jgi:hypothetical protein
MEKNNNNEKAISFQNYFQNISPTDLEEIMEWLKDNGYLSKEGKTFKNKFWELFIRESNINNRIFFDELNERWTASTAATSANATTSANK